MLAVLGVPQLLTYYFDQRDRRRARAEDRAEAERARREERAEADRRHHEMMTALDTGKSHCRATALLETQRRRGSSDQSELIEQLRRRVAELETENARLRNGDGIAGD